MADTKDIKNSLNELSEYKCYWVEEVFKKPKEINLDILKDGIIDPKENYLVCGSFKTVEYFLRKLELSFSSFL